MDQNAHGVMRLLRRRCEGCWMNLDSLNEGAIAAKLAAALRRSNGKVYPEFQVLKDLVQGTPRTAGVLIPLLQQEGGWGLLFTRRHANLPEHSGQVAFPGGRSDPEDESIEATALREAHEEVGIPAGQVRVLGKLHEFLTITNYLVTPVVGVMPWPYPLRPSGEEVARAFTIPLAWLADPANHEIRHRELPPPYDPVPVIYFHEYDGEVLWGATARFTLTFIEVLSE